MFEVIESGNVIHLKANGRLIHDDYQQVVPKLEEALGKYDKVRVCFEMTEFHGMTPRAAYDDLKFDITYGKRVERLAVIGNTTWKKWLSGFCRLVFHNSEFRYFDTAELDEAMEWLNEGSEE